MKPRIRKFLAGVLSLGMLLQAASPLSALATDDGSSAADSGTAPTLTVTVNDQTYPIDSQTDSITINYQKYSNSVLTDYTATIGVAFSDNTYTLTGTFPSVNTTIDGTGNPNLVMDGEGEAAATADRFTVNGIHDFTGISTSTTTSAFGKLYLTCTGNIKITSPSTCTDWLGVKSGQNVELISGGQGTGYANVALQGADIVCSGNVTLENTHPTGALSNYEVGITTPGMVTLSCNSTRVMTSYSRDYRSFVTSGGLIMKNPSGPFGKVTFQKHANSTDALLINVGSSANDLHPQRGITAKDTSSKYLDSNDYTADYRHYLSIMPGEYEEYDVYIDEYSYSSNKAKLSNLNKDNYKLYTTVFTYDPDHDILTAQNDISGRAIRCTITGTGKTAVNLKNSASNVTVQKVSDLVIDGGLSVEYDGRNSHTLKVSDCTGNVTINGIVTGDAFVEADGNVKIIGSSTTALVGESDTYGSTFKTKSLLLENDGGGSLGRMTFTKLDSSKTYLVTTGKSSDSSTRQTETMSGNTYSITRNDDISYLYIREVTPPAAETLTVKVDGTTYNINSYSTAIGDTGVAVEFENGTYTLTGAFGEGAAVEIIGANTPDLELDLTSQLNKLNLVGLGDVNISSTAAGAVTANGLTASAKSLTVNNTVGIVGRVVFTPIGSGDYKVTTGSSETNTYEPEPLQNGAYNEILNLGYLSISSGKVFADPQLIVTVDGTKYELNPESTTLADKVTVAYQNGVYTLSGHLSGDVTITGKAYKGTLPGLKWVGTPNGSIYYDIVGSLTVKDVDSFQWNINYYGAKALTLENCGNVDIIGSGFVTTGETIIDGAEDVTLTAKAYNGDALGGGAGNVTITCSGDVTLTNEEGGLTGNALTITTPGTVTLNANRNGTTSTVTGGLTITARKLIVDNEGSSSIGTVTFNGAKADYIACVSKKYKANTIDIPNGTHVKNRYLYVGPESEYVPVPVSEPTLTLTADGKTYTLDSETTEIEELGITVQYGNGEYTLIGGFTKDVAITGTPYNNKKPSVILQNENGTIVDGSLTISGVEDFSAEGSGIVTGSLDVAASGEVELDAASGSIVGSGNKLTVSTTSSVSLNGSSTDGILIPADASASIKAGKLTAQNEGGKIGTIIFTPASRGDCLVNDRKTELDETGTIIVSDEDISAEDGETGLVVEIDTSTIPSDSSSSGGGSGIGGAVAAAMVGSAAVWGGYQIATRVILHNILPEGTAIPATRGELALLVWNAAGRPEPASAPAFTDVADADMAKAAQWCVEQGLLDAKTETTFNPDGLVTKVKVIEVWNKTFPNK